MNIKNPDAVKIGIAVVWRLDDPARKFGAEIPNLEITFSGDISVSSPKYILLASMYPGIFGPSLFHQISQKCVSET